MHAKLQSFLLSIFLTAYCSVSIFGNTKIIEHKFSNNSTGLSVALANVENKAPLDSDKNLFDAITENKAKIIEIIDSLKKHDVNMLIFPEFTLTGYFWPDQAWTGKGYNPKGNPECWKYMNAACIDNNMDFIKVLKNKLNDNLKYILINVLRKNPENRDNPATPDNKFFNTTIVINKDFDTENINNNEKFMYDKIFIPGIENIYEISGIKGRKVIETEWGKFGLETCYDLCFPILAKEYAYIDKVDGIICMASWRCSSSRSYTTLNIHKNNYYDYQWDVMCPATAMFFQVWLITCNVVGHQKKGNYEFWGNSGIWTPAGIKAVEVPDNEKAIVILKNIEIKKEVKREHDDFYYHDDFVKYYKMDNEK